LLCLCLGLEYCTSVTLLDESLMDEARSHCRDEKSCNTRPKYSASMIPSRSKPPYQSCLDLPPSITSSHHPPSQGTTTPPALLASTSLNPLNSQLTSTPCIFLNLVLASFVTGSTSSSSGNVSSSLLTNLLPGRTIVTILISVLGGGGRVSVFVVWKEDLRSLVKRDGSTDVVLAPVFLSVGRSGPTCRNSRSRVPNDSVGVMEVEDTGDSADGGGLVWRTSWSCRQSDVTTLKRLERIMPE